MIINYQKRTNDELFKSLEKEDFTDLQNYLPIYNKFFSLNEKNYNSFIPNIQPGIWNKIHEGVIDKCILTTGATLNIAHDWIQTEEYKNYSICTLPIWGMRTKEIQIQSFLILNHRVHREIGLCWLVFP